MGRMVRTNVVIDESLVKQVMARYGLESRRSAINFALHAVMGQDEAPITNPWRAALELEGMWADMTDEEARGIWGDEVPDGPNAKQPPKKHGSR